MDTEKMRKKGIAMFRIEKKYCAVLWVFALLFSAGGMGKLSAGPVKVPAECEQFVPEIKAVCPAFDRFGSCTARKVTLLDAKGAAAGYLLLAPEKYSRTKGYKGYVNTAVILGKDGKIIGTVLGRNQESPGWIGRIRKGGLLTRWNGMTVKEGATAQVDGVTRATYSSNAIKAEVKAILENAK